MDNYEWWLGDERKTIVANRTYFVDTRKVHRTHSWADNSYHLILNVQNMGKCYETYERSNFTNATK